MEPIEYWKSQLRSKLRNVAELEESRGRMLRNGKYIESINLNGKIDRMQLEIADLKAKIAEYERIEAESRSKPLREFLETNTIIHTGFVDAMLELVLAADYLTDCAYVVNDKVESFGLKPTTILPEIEQVRGITESIVNNIVNRDIERLTDLITDNETLIDALRRKTRKYIEQRMGKVKKKKK